MTSTVKLFACVAFACLTGCGSLQTVKVATAPVEYRGYDFEVSTQPATQGGIAPKSQPLGNDGLYLAQSGGGSLAVGLLFGAVGSGVNRANVAAETDRLVNAAAHSNLLQLKPVDELNSVSREVHAGPKVGKGALRISPYLIFYVDDERKSVYPVAGFKTEALSSSTGKSQGWNGHYLFAINKLLPLDSLKQSLPDEQLKEFRALLRSAYTQLHAELLADFVPRSTGAALKQVASVKSPYLKATQIGFAGYTVGDVDISSNGSMSVRIDIENYGPAMDRSVPYFVWYFPSSSQYTFDLGPEPRKGPG